ncbi:hypothetical protein [Sinorhizobium terangae]|uniref:Uncharacterized protein n=1 Tax=Sinorhizobium terangae TaxID=110322 RepID=A0A6N7LFJ8_SINTE|nr:hypothetical protein [Sinorhizobium terangae]MBB4187178.1 hypothetical protein [Sinorhizobium terangae]MQX16577.1 hypothetical protein [Sinorhizobium terangae]WFU50086.1 hypothetical protein QA637_25130 [Sinorhizobium terangae]
MNEGVNGFRAIGKYHTEPSFRFRAYDDRPDRLKQQVEAEIASGGRGWRLLKLEWQYDLVILFENFRAWIRRLDRDFDRAA